MPPPLVSIGLPTYDRAASLERAARSALAQDWGELELVISDNGSDDGTQAVCEALRDADPRVRYLRQAANLGPLRNFQEVLEHSRGELFMWLGDDDSLDPSYVSECASVLLANDDHTLVCGRARYYRDGAFAFAERDVNLLADSPTRRIAGFYRQVTLNGAFYGVMRRGQAVQVPLVPDVGGDWLLVAHLAFLGKVRTLRSTAIHRSLGGSSRDASALADLHGVPRMRGGNWQLAVARNARKDVAERPVYSVLPRWRRRLLGAYAFALVVARFSLKTWAGSALARLGLFDRARRLLEGRRRSADAG
jgi:glycosyltransferase involved in cell wall biosynthesis